MRRGTWTGSSPCTRSATSLRGSRGSWGPCPGWGGVRGRSRHRRPGPSRFGKRRPARADEGRRSRASGPSRAPRSWMRSGLPQASNEAMYQRLAGERIVGRTEADVAWWIVSPCYEDRRRRRRVRSDRRRAARMPRCRTTIRESGRSARTRPCSSTRAPVDGYRSDCTRTFATGDPSGQSSSRRTTSAEAPRRARSRR